MTPNRTILAVASGKGGTGKTTVAVNLALFLADGGGTVQYLDCDVEEPNGHLFLQPQVDTTGEVGIPVPVVDEARCTGCGTCAGVCRYGAITVLRKPLLFAELCHGCGGCALACPEGAIREQDRPVGTVESGRAGPLAYAGGRLNVGEPMAPPLIRAVRAKTAATGLAILDSPPGTSCPVVTAVRGADFVVLVTEPTPFGLHDLRLAVEMVRRLGLRHGVVVNRADAGDSRVRDYCAAESIPLLLEIPDDRRVAEACSRGEIALRVLPEWAGLMDLLAARVCAASAAPAEARP